MRRRCRGVRLGAAPTLRRADALFRSLRAVLTAVIVSSADHVALYFGTKLTVLLVFVAAAAAFYSHLRAAESRAVVGASGAS